MLTPTFHPSPCRPPAFTFAVIFCYNTASGMLFKTPSLLPQSCIQFSRYSTYFYFLCSFAGVRYGSIGFIIAVIPGEKSLEFYHPICPLLPLWDSSSTIFSISHLLCHPHPPLPPLYYSSFVVLVILPLFRIYYASTLIIVHLHCPLHLFPYPFLMSYCMSVYAILITPCLC